MNEKYLFLFREENDIDAELYKPLYMSVPAFEKEVLEQKIGAAMSRGEATEAMERRLEELERMALAQRKKIQDMKKFPAPWKIDDSKSPPSPAS